MSNAKYSHLSKNLGLAVQVSVCLLLGKLPRFNLQPKLQPSHLAALINTLRPSVKKKPKPMPKKERSIEVDMKCKYIPFTTQYVISSAAWGKRDAV